MTDVAVGATGLGALLVLLALRMPVGLALMAVGWIGIWYLNGFRAAGSTMVSTAFGLGSNYALVIIPLFVLMGNVAAAAGMSRSLFDAAQVWIGRWRGGLASASVVGCAAFSAVSGSSIATSITMGRVALPEMLRAGYAPGLATGAIAAGGTLGILIPPSTGFVLYALLTEESIGQLFMAGVVPGLLMSGLFLIAIRISARKMPGQRIPVTTAQALQVSLRALPLILVVAVSIGGIYLGVFTPAEVAGVGAFLVTALALALRQISLRALGPVLRETIQTTAMLFVIVIGASVFGPFLSLTRLPGVLVETLTALPIGAWGTLALILLCYIVLGTFLEAFAMLVITLPIFAPIVAALGFDMIWFGVLVVIVVEMGMITPPVGLNVFVVKAVAGDVPMATIFRGVMPFWVAMLVALLLIVIFPQIALMVPQSMF